MAEIDPNQEMEFIQTSKKITTIEDMFNTVIDFEASDIHLQVGNHPIIRIDGILKKMNCDILTHESMEKILSDLLPPEKISILKTNGDLDFAYGIQGKGRMRINIFYQRGSISMAGRLVNTIIPSFQELNLPPEPFKKITKLHSGMVILAGITGAGKSTTLAALIDKINKERECHILTIEDPLEYLHSNKRSYISQREVGIDVKSFSVALKYALRQDPDVILVGEMRDAETIQFGLTAAETGHLVLTTLHASSCSGAIGRILDHFPADQQTQIRQSLQFNLKSVICQKLIPSCNEKVGRVPANEIMFVNATIKELLRKAEDIKILNAIRQGGEELMQDFNKSLINLVEQKLITKELALNVSPYPDTLKMNFKGIYLSEDRAIF